MYKDRKLKNTPLVAYFFLEVIMLIVQLAVATMIPVLIFWIILHCRHCAISHSIANDSYVHVRCPLDHGSLLNPGSTLTDIDHIDHILTHSESKTFVCVFVILASGLNEKISHLVTQSFWVCLIAVALLTHSPLFHHDT